MIMLIFVALIAKFWWLFFIIMFLLPLPYVMRYVQPVQQEIQQSEDENYENMKFDMGGTMMKLEDFPPRYRKQIEEQLKKERR